MGQKQSEQRWRGRGDNFGSGIHESEAGTEKDLNMPWEINKDDIHDLDRLMSNIKF